VNPTCFARMIGPGKVSHARVELKHGDGLDTVSRTRHGDQGSRARIPIRGYLFTDDGNNGIGTDRSEDAARKSTEKQKKGAKLQHGEINKERNGNKPGGAHHRR